MEFNKACEQAIQICEYDAAFFTKDINYSGIQQKFTTKVILDMGLASLSDHSYDPPEDIRIDAIVESNLLKTESIKELLFCIFTIKKSFFSITFLQKEYFNKRFSTLEVALKEAKESDIEHAIKTIQGDSKSVIEIIKKNNEGIEMKACIERCKKHIERIQNLGACPCQKLEAYFNRPYS